MALMCPDCGNRKSFQVKTLQMHLLQVEETGLFDAETYGDPAVLEVLCDECETEIDFGALARDQRREMHLLLGVD